MGCVDCKCIMGNVPKAKIAKHIISVCPTQVQRWVGFQCRSNVFSIVNMIIIHYSRKIIHLSFFFCLVVTSLLSYYRILNSVSKSPFELWMEIILTEFLNSGR